MFASRSAVYPVDAPLLTEAAENPAAVRMKDVQGTAGIRGGLLLRLFQLFFAIAALCIMTTTSDFSSVSSFCYLVAAVSLQSLWSLSLAFVDVYALLVKRSLCSRQVACLFTIGDGITSTLTYTSACASAGITLLIGNDLNICAENDCASFEMAAAMALVSYFFTLPSFFLDFWALASK